MLFDREASRNKVKLLDQVRITFRTNLYSRKTIVEKIPINGIHKQKNSKRSKKR